MAQAISLRSYVVHAIGTHPPVRQVGLTCLFRRGDTFYFRRRVPGRLVATFAAPEVKHSLRTSDIALARSRCLRAACWVERLFRVAQASPVQLTAEKVQELVRAYFAQRHCQSKIETAATARDRLLR